MCVCSSKLKAKQQKFNHPLFKAWHIATLIKWYFNIKNRSVIIERGGEDEILHTVIT